MEKMKTQMTEQPKRLGARSLLKKIFAERYAILDDLEEGRMGFTYGYDANKEEYIIVEADDVHINVRLMNCYWHEVSRWDIEEVTRIQSLINKCNMLSRSKVVYHFDDNDKMQLSTLLTFPLYDGIPDVADYFTAQLMDLIQTHDFILNEKTDTVEDDGEKAERTESPVDNTKEAEDTEKKGGKAC